jgi:O-antigen/teichoic acid export membrane protein
LDRDLKCSLPIMERTPTGMHAVLAAQRHVAVPADASMIQRETRGLWVSALRTAWATWQPQALALADQAVVSGTSFLTTVVIGRFTLPSELGVYAMGLSAVQCWLGIQECLVSFPYTIHRHRPLGTPAEYAGSSLTHNGLLSAVAIVVTAVIALVMSAGSGVPELAAVTCALAGVLPLALLREFGRRFALAHLHTAECLIVDIAVAALQLVGLGLLAWTDRLSAITAFAALGAACAVVGAVWLYRVRDNFVLRNDQLWETMQQSWSLGKWLFGNQLTWLVQANITYWLLAWVAGPTASGIYAACMSVALFANPVIMGVANTLTPTAVVAFREGGGARLRREVTRNSLLLGGVVSLFCVAVLLAGEDLMRLLYHSKEYAGHGHAVTVLALGMLAMAVGMPVMAALLSIERPREVFWTAAFGALVTGVLVWWFAAEWGILGAAYGFLAGNVARTATRWVMFEALVPQSGDPFIGAA